MLSSCIYRLAGRRLCALATGAVAALAVAAPGVASAASSSATSATAVSALVQPNTGSWTTPVSSDDTGSWS